MKNAGRILLVLIVLTTAVRAAQMAVNESYYGPGAGQKPADLVIPPGDSATVAATLAGAGVIQYKSIFRLAAWFTRHDGRLRAGEYLFPAHASVAQILNILRHGTQVQHQATIPEGLTGAQIAKIINALPAATGRIQAPADGTVLPETYDYVWGTPRGFILARMEAAMTDRLNGEWARRAQNLPLRSPQEALILASIVQQETPFADEMPKIAAVYENRLRQGMRLQADPTVIYAVSNGAQSGGTEITKADLENASPYNTYVHEGLPPGPICAPGVTAIKAVLHPAASEDMYFVASRNGGRSSFSRFFKDQLDNIQQFWDRHK